MVSLGSDSSVRDGQLSRHNILDARVTALRRVREDAVRLHNGHLSEHTPVLSRCEASYVKALLDSKHVQSYKCLVSCTCFASTLVQACVTTRTMRQTQCTV